ncbi:MAG: glycosyltransferase family 39 protein [Cyanobacteria bacterium P01_F01_bin.116]
MLSDWLLPLCFIALILLLIPFGRVFDYNLDEGFELMRAYLQNQGLLLYQDIWSDQPPLFSQALRGWLQLFGNSVFSARLLVLLFSSSLLYFFYRTLKIFFDKTTAVFGVMLLSLTRDFLPFSIQVKVDMPALSLGMASIFFLLCGLHHTSKKIKYGFLVASGILLGLAIFIKLYVVMLGVVSVLYTALIYSQNHRNSEARKQILKALCYWSIGLMSCICILGLGFYIWLGDSILDQLIGSHLSAEDYFADLNLLKLINEASRKDSSFWLLSALGLLVLGSKERWRIVFPTLWFSVCLWIFYDHTPLWPHYYLLLAMPMAWFASALLFWVKQQLPTANYLRVDVSPGKIRLRHLLAFLASVVIGTVLFSHVLLNLKVLAKGQHPTQSGANRVKEEILSNVMEFGGQTHWLATDMAMFGVRANLKVPPEIAVLSRKRVLAQSFNGADFLNVLKKYNAEQVLLGRFVEDRFDPPFLSDATLSKYLNDYYVDITVPEQTRYPIRHYVRRTLSSAAQP